MKNLIQKILLEKKWLIEGFWIAALGFVVNNVVFLSSKEVIETNIVIKIAILSVFTGIFWGYFSRWRALRIHKKKQEV